jgi:hypothetical protein
MKQIRKLYTLFEYLHIKRLTENEANISSKLNHHLSFYPHLNYISTISNKKYIKNQENTGL